STICVAALPRSSRRVCMSAVWSCENVVFTLVTPSRSAVVSQDAVVEVLSSLSLSFSVSLSVATSFVSLFGDTLDDCVAWVTVLVLFVYLGISLWVANGVTRVERLPLDPPATAIAASHEDVAFRSRDGLLLRGWWFGVAGADRAVVIVHGRARNRVNSSFHPAEIARMLLRHRYSVLLFDLRAHGESEGTRYTLGIEEPRDIL